MVRVGLIGFGLAGQAFHAPVIRGVRGMELACILERECIGHILWYQTILNPDIGLTEDVPAA